jgi:hypothetical protein
MTMITLSGLIVVAQHSLTMGNQSQAVFVAVRAAPHWIGEQPDHHLGNRGAGTAIRSSFMNSAFTVGL